MATETVRLYSIDSSGSSAREHGLYQIGISTLQTGDGNLEIDLS